MFHNYKLKGYEGLGTLGGCAGNRRERRECGKARVWVLGVERARGKVGPKELGDGEDRDAE